MVRVQNEKWDDPKPQVIGKYSIINFALETIEGSRQMKFKPSNELL